MKKILTLLAIVTGFAVMAPADTQARDYRSSYGRSFSHSCRTCGTGVYRERVIVGRDRYGRPISSWRTVGHHCRPQYRHYNHPHHKHHHKHHHNHGRGGPIIYPGFGRF